jgi:hypothetical protein
MEKQRSFSLKSTRLLVFSFTIISSVVFFTFFTIWVIKSTPLFRQETHFQFNESSLRLGLRSVTVQTLSTFGGNFSATGEKKSILIDAHYRRLENVSGERGRGGTLNPEGELRHRHSVAVEFAVSFTPLPFLFFEGSFGCEENAGKYEG